ncbi:substrate-binding domain-containing protein [Actinotalea sp. K2]|uniref:LacI family DNA-binding transcriptional regulator n=1 Tax=Actinotalea sp. K2 TaxID=2939438 RepID=UPI0020178F7C|nr:substrate-binding domain-containing protein [Actinotalea sp. K2]MCL3862214.1 substrate-binding domain-containing protein [Actinotalea sp. K2]
MDGRPTLQSVADRAAVSRQTVSNVLNAPHLVRPETLERVQSVIDEVGYRPHGAARQLRTRRSRVIGLRLQPSVDGINGAVLDRFLHALTEQAQLRGYRVMLFTATDDHAEIGQYSELLDTLEIDAFVLTSTHHGDPRTRWLADHDVPFVTFGRPWDPPADGATAPEHAWVDVDGAAGTRAAVEHLQSLGHRRIAFLGWPAGSDTGDDRRLGWRRAVQAAGVPDHELDALDVGVLDGVTNGAQAAHRLLAHVSPTAFVCASDSLALGALAVTRSPAAVAGPTGRRADLPSPAVIGFDDTPVARAVGLSSVAQPLTEAAGRSLSLLLEQLSARHQGPSTTTARGNDHHVLLSPSLVVRESSAPSA